MENKGSNPSTAILQGSPAAHSIPPGAQPRFRARLSAASMQRFHQISLLSELERSGRIELLVATLATSHSAIELRPPTSRTNRLGSLFVCRFATPAELAGCSGKHGGRRVELNAMPRKDGVYSAARAPARLTCVSRDGSGPENRTRLKRLMRPHGSPDLYPRGSGGAPTCRSPCPFRALIRFERRSEAAPIDAP